MKHFSFVFIFFTVSLFAQNSDRTCDLFEKINDLLQREHFRPKPVNDSLSVFVFDTFMDNLDSNRNLFTQAEYKNLCQHRLKIDDYILTKNCRFMDDFVSVYTFALNRKKLVLEKLQKENLNYNIIDSVRFSKDFFPFDMQENNIEKIWNKRIRFDILEEIAKSGKNSDSLHLNFISLEKIARETIFDNNLCKVNSILNSKKGLANDLQNSILNIFCSYFDPHSNYFSIDAKESFMSGLSTSNLSLGLNVGLNDKEEIVVEEIVPGGPAAKTEKIDKEDIIVKVGNTKGEEYIVSCTSLDKIGELIFSDSNLEIQLTLKKKDGRTTDVLLAKKEMKSNANAVYSYIIEKENKVGYISIPSFYADFDGNGTKGCAQDVADEIKKLQKDDIQSLIIDLQDNGGGSMDEAIKLCGIFLGNEPISVLLNHKKKQNILRDYNQICNFKGALVVLVNGNSASASEFFASAMQDYNRAIILGSKTLGKASMQVILPVDENNQEDFVKVTIQKFYRVTGDSNQIKGIIPDIYYPVLFDSVSPNEKSYKTALPYDKINLNLKFSSFSRTTFEKAIKISQLRLKQKETFNKLNDLNQKINVFYNFQKKPVCLDLDNVFNDVHSVDALWKNVKDLVEIRTNCKISNHSFDTEKYKSDKYESEINEFRIKDVQNNPYVEEGVEVIQDLLKM